MTAVSISESVAAAVTVPVSAESAAADGLSATADLTRILPLVMMVQEVQVE